MIRSRRARRLLGAGAVISAVLVVCVGVASRREFRREFRLQTQKARACAQCRVIARAIEEYDSGSGLRSPGLSDMEREKLPDSLSYLLRPPHGPSLLMNGEADLIDPWGQPFQLQFRERPDGSIGP
jgi:hypothetical protein